MSSINDEATLNDMVDSLMNSFERMDLFGTMGLGTMNEEHRRTELVRRIREISMSARYTGTDVIFWSYELGVYRRVRELPVENLNDLTDINYLMTTHLRIH